MCVGVYAMLLMELAAFFIHGHNPRYLFEHRVHNVFVNKLGVIEKAARETKEIKQTKLNENIFYAIN